MELTPTRETRPSPYRATEAQGPSGDGRHGVHAVTLSDSMPHGPQPRLDTGGPADPLPGTGSLERIPGTGRSAPDRSRSYLRSVCPPLSTCG